LFLMRIERIRKNIIHWLSLVKLCNLLFLVI
jgi:hypothetical protein